MIKEIIAEGLRNGEIKLSDTDLKNKQENEICDKLAKIIGSQENPEFTVIELSRMFEVNEKSCITGLANLEKKTSN